MQELAVRIDGAGFAYRPGRWIFRRCSAAIERGRIVAVLGTNGRGKTTLLKILVGALRATEGKIETKGRVAFVPQLFGTSFDYNVIDIVLMGRAKNIGLFAQPSEEDRTLAMAALNMLGLESYASRPIHELSGGQRQLALIARAIVGNAEILIFDEPTSALDFKNQALVLQTIHRLAKQEGLTIVFSTHQPNHALAIADDALMLMAESEHIFGSVPDVVSEDQISRLYDLPMRRVELPGSDAPIFAPILRPIR
jgi:iron complex transport system ATP-binding protein